MHANVLCFLLGPRPFCPLSDLGLVDPHLVPLSFWGLYQGLEVSTPTYVVTVDAHIIDVIVPHSRVIVTLQ